MKLDPAWHGWAWLGVAWPGKAGRGKARGRRANFSLAVALCAALPFSAHAQSWRPIARQCAEEINQQLHCASCGGAWPMWVDCTVQRAYGGQIDNTRLQQCKQAIWDRRIAERTCAMCGDPVAESIRCAGGE